MNMVAEVEGANTATSSKVEIRTSFAIEPKSLPPFV
jgi:hypothetical protein